MSPLLKIFAATVVLLLASTSFTRSHAQTSPVEQFNWVVFPNPPAAHPFVLADLDGNQIALADYRGQHVLINFWATWCPPCVEEIPSLQALYRQSHAQRLTVLALSSDEDGISAVKPFADQFQVTFPMLLDSRGTVAGSYGASLLPVSFLVNPGGEVVAAAQGARDWTSDEAVQSLAILMGGRQ